MATDCRILLEDGSALLEEDGSNLLLDGCTPAGGTDTGCDILLEDGSLLLQEDGSSAFLLENCEGTAVVSSLGGVMFAKGLRIPLEPEDDEMVAVALLALMRRRRWRLSG